MAISIHNIPSQQFLEMQEILPSHRGDLNHYFKKIEGIARYYQNIGALHPSISPPGGLESRISQKTVCAMGNTSLPGSAGTVFLTTQIGEKGITSFSNALNAIPAIARSQLPIHLIAYPAGGIGTLFALWEIKEGMRDLRRAQLIGDNEGIRRAGSRLFSGSVITGGSLAFLANQVSSAYAASSLALAALNGLSTLFFGIGTAVAIGVSGLGYRRCHRFNAKINQYLENQAISEEERLRGALLFLQGSLMIIPQEREDLTKEMIQKNPQMDPVQRERFLEKKLADLSEVKIKYLKRRTSSRSLQLIHGKAGLILEKLESRDPSIKAQGIEEGRELVQQIQAENRKKRILYAITLIAASIGLIAILAGTFFSLGTVPLVLSAIAGGIYSLLTIQNWIFQWIKKRELNAARLTVITN